MLTSSGKGQLSEWVVFWGRGGGGQTTTITGWTNSVAQPQRQHPVEQIGLIPVYSIFCQAHGPGPYYHIARSLNGNASQYIYELQTIMSVSAALPYRDGISCARLG